MMKKLCGEIVVEEGAGLGNQMNIYAAGRAYSIKNKCSLYLDTSWFDSFPKYRFSRTFGLNKFKISGKIASEEKIKKYIYKSKFRYLNKIFRKFRFLEKKVYEEHQDFKDVEEFLGLPVNSYLRGYYNLSYFKHIRNILVKELQLKEEYGGQIKKLLGAVSKCDSVSIHVRRGDLLKIRDGFVLPMDYYKKAVEKIKKKIKCPEFYIFGDDPEWCEKNFDWIPNKTIVRGNNVEQDFELMKNCKHNITANSSLSWWSAYLNNYPHKIVIAPEVYTMFPKKDSIQKLNKNIPPEWIRI